MKIRNPVTADYGAPHLTRIADEFDAAIGGVILGKPLAAADGCQNSASIESEIAEGDVGAKARKSGCREQRFSNVHAVAASA